jgi:hypothetical protein
MSLKYAPAAAASNLRAEYAKTGPCGADSVAKHTDGHHCGMGANAAKAPGYLNQKAPGKDGPQVLKGY